MNPFEFERRICRFWRLYRSPFAVTKYERRAERSLENLPDPKPVKEGEIGRALRRARVVALGDDRLVAADQERISRLLAKFGRKGDVFLTDRTRKQGLEVVRGLRMGIRVCGRAGSLEKQDERLARECVKQVRGAGRVWIWTGSQRLAACHLPKRLKALGESPVVLDFEAKAFRWRSRRDHGWVCAGEDYWGFVGGSPLVPILTHVAWKEREGSLLRPEEVKRSFGEALRMIEARIGVRRIRRPRVVLTPFRISDLTRLSGLKLSRSEAVFLKERIRRGESAVLPRLPLVWLATLLPGEVAEEAAHLCRSAGRGAPRGFHSAVLEEAFGFLAGRWRSSGRSRPHLPGRGGGVFERVHEEGYRLGERMDRAWRRSEQARARIRALWREAPSDESRAEFVCEFLRSLK